MLTIALRVTCFSGAASVVRDDDGDELHDDDRGDIGDDDDEIALSLREVEASALANVQHFLTAHVGARFSIIGIGQTKDDGRRRAALIVAVLRGCGVDVTGIIDVDGEARDGGARDCDAGDGEAILRVIRTSA